MSAVIEVENVSKWYGEVVGLNGFSARVGKGITGLVGPNGAGKSTLIKMLVGLNRPNKGSISVLGGNPFDNPGVIGRIGYCPDTERTYDSLDSVTFLTYMARMQGLTKEEASKRAHKCLDEVGLDVLSRPIRTYSKGMRQRVKIAQALLNSPQLLILDEPFAGVDPLVRAQLFEILRTLSNRGIDILLSSHILFEIDRLATDVVLMTHGKHIVSGKIDQILDTIEDHTHSLLLTVDDPHRMGSILLGEGLACVAEVRDGSRLFVRTTRPKEFYCRIPQICMEGCIVLGGMVPQNNDLQTIFDKVVGK